MEEYYNLPRCNPNDTPACTFYNNWDDTEKTLMDTDFLTTEFSIEPVAGDLVFSYVELQNYGWDFHTGM